MAEGKDTRSFFRKVVNFVVNPKPPADPAVSEADEGGRPSDFAKSELKAMIERKRRNDFVRKRELDLLRKLRREGLTPEQLAALGSSSAMADTEARPDEAELPDAPEMKAKIDAIEQQMNSQAIPVASRREAPRPAASDPRSRMTAARLAEMNELARSMADTVIDAAQLDAEPAPTVASSGFDLSRPPSGTGPAVEVTEAVHDPELDEAVICYANGESSQAEQLLMKLIREGGSRRQHAETWMVVFDLYRATGQQARFETLALEFAERFSRSAPHWFSVPKMIAAGLAAELPKRPPAGDDVQADWTSPVRIDLAAVAQLDARLQRRPSPWVIDWSELQHLDAGARAALIGVFERWVQQAVEMRWIGGETLLNWLAQATPIAEGGVDPLLWQLRLLVLRMVNRPDRFDEVAIDYCVTYEVSPPSWQAAACRVRISSPPGAPTGPPTETIVGPPSTSLVEQASEAGPLRQISLELGGQMVGDIGPVLRKLDDRIADASLVELSCTKLLRVDFMAAGDLLNWVLVHNRAQRSVGFVETNRLVALFFSAIGIDTYATVKVRAV